MKKLNVNQMENVQGGDAGCAFAILGLAGAFLSLSLVTTPAGGVFGVVGMVSAGVGMGACK